MLPTWTSPRSSGPAALPLASPRPSRRRLPASASGSSLATRPGTNKASAGPVATGPPSPPCLACCGHAQMRTTAGGIDVDEQPGFVVEGARVALGPLRMDLVATYQRWENDLE